MVSKHKYGSKMEKKKISSSSSELIISLLGAQVQGLLGESGSMCSRCYHNNRRPFFFSTKNRNRKIRTERKRGDTSSPTHHQKRIEYLDNQIEIEKKNKIFLSTPFQTKFHFPCVNNFLAGTKIQQKKKRKKRNETFFILCKCWREIERERESVVVVQSWSIPSTPPTSCGVGSSSTPTSTLFFSSSSSYLFIHDGR